MRYIPRVICVLRVTRLPTMRTWLTQGAEHSIFLWSVKNRGIFVTFMQDSSGTFVLYCDSPAFSVEIVLMLLALEATPTMKHSHWWISGWVWVWISGVWLRKYLIRGTYIACLILSSLIKCIYSCWVSKPCAFISASRHPKYYCTRLSKLPYTCWWGC